MMIKCCRNCVPPKRYPGCGDKCKEYQEEKEKTRLESEWLRKSNERDRDIIRTSKGIRLNGKRARKS